MKYASVTYDTDTKTVAFTIHKPYRDFYWLWRIDVGQDWAYDAQSLFEAVTAGKKLDISPKAKGWITCSACTDSGEGDLLPGTKFAALPHEEQISFAKQLVDLVRANHNSNYEEGYGDGATSLSKAFGIDSTEVDDLSDERAKLVVNTLVHGRIDS